MKNKRYRKEHKGFVSKLIVLISVVAVVTVCSIVGVMANTVPCTVVDGGRAYSFSLITPDMDGIISKAVSQGMEPLSEKDMAVKNEENGQIEIKRSINVSANTNGEFVNLSAYKGETVESVLLANGVAFSQQDDIEPTLDTALTADTVITINSTRSVVVTADGVTRAIETEGTTVKDALNDLGIVLGDGDKVNRQLSDKLTAGMTINVSRVKNIKISDDGTEQDYKVYGTNVRLVLKELGIKLDKEDKLNLKPGDKIAEGTLIEITRIQHKETKATESIEYKTVYEDSAEMLSGETKVKTAGVNGEKEVTYRELYKNGEFIEKVASSEKVIKAAVDEVVIRGTKTPPSQETVAPPPPPPPVNNVPSGGSSTFVDYNGDVVAYSNILTGSGTAYCIPGGTTSIGLPVAVGIVAVDPDIIPYGTRMYIEADGLVYGYAVAGDTGGALLCGDALVDVYYDTLEECYTFGRRNCTVYILS